jgi:hypothetical protein
MNQPFRRRGPATFVSIAIAASTLAAGSVSGTAYASSSASAPAQASASTQYPITGVPGWHDAGDLLLQGTPPDTAVVRAHLKLGGQPAWVFLWFGYTSGHRDEGLQLCLESLVGASEASGYVYDSCGAARLPAGAAGAQVSELGFPPGPDGFSIGVTTSVVTSVGLQQSFGGDLAGLVEYGRGFPYHVWLMTYLLMTGSTLDFRDAAGHQVGQLVLGASSGPATPPSSGGITVLRAPGGPLSAYLLDGYVEFFQSESGSIAGTASASTAWQAPLAAFLMQGTIAGRFFVVGWAPADAVRIVLRLGNGKQLAAPALPGWRGSGLRLWGVSGVPGTIALKEVAIAYNAKGKVIGQTQLS